MFRLNVWVGSLQLASVDTWKLLDRAREAAQQLANNLNESIQIVNIYGVVVMDVEPQE